MAALCVVWVALSIPAAVVMADMFLGRGAVDPQALGGLIGALISLYEQKTGMIVTISESAPVEVQSA